MNDDDGIEGELWRFMTEAGYDVLSEFRRMSHYMWTVKVAAPDADKYLLVGVEWNQGWTIVDAEIVLRSN